jgi:hypothetical protein
MLPLFDAAVFVAGFTACWFLKDRITQLIVGGEAFTKSLEAKALSRLRSNDRQDQGVLPSLAYNRVGVPSCDNRLRDGLH